MSASLVAKIDCLLPQTQCTRCGYPACRPYAEAIASGAADIDQCPPGGQAGVDALAALLGRASKPLNAAFGIESNPTVAVIDENVCIGCTKCIQACPVDAIVGSAKRMHTIIATECTGCELCIPPCPVDCIVMVATSAMPLMRAEILDRAIHSRQRFEARNRRLARKGGERNSRRETGQRIDAPRVAPISRDAVLEAIARGKAKREAMTNRTDGSSSQ
ncbi:MAG: RnfABCDGE type electron transport complex subunit B [Dokdonella sp.]|uniref:RnfABCDGE type electron transport complex subunit B n=1 Tax=Dokdonella sp. TaxID=2291710 RepID=UPI002C0233D4|nr:RnfABCDGE type electron transport complex subunit B [Dokdonella sp.]HOX71222.1 RnfABCDGE type electron transport complex subunit B [Dokdonella sp.]HPN78923.1 RnfABCDGE type electron transport complex subunit B [Dokdonella sp.]